MATPEAHLFMRVAQKKTLDKQELIRNCEKLQPRPTKLDLAMHYCNGPQYSDIRSGSSREMEVASYVKCCKPRRGA